MSNGIGVNPLNAISKVYLEQIAEKKDDTYLEPDMKKRQKNNEKARKDMEKMGTSMKNPHFEEVEVDEAMSSYDRNRKRAAQRAAERNAARAAGKTGVVPGVGYVSPRKERETYVDSAGTTRHKSGAKMEGLDPVGKEDGDVNNDGKKDSTDSYLMKRRKAIGKAIKGKMMKKESVQQVTEGDGDPCWDTHKQVGMKKKGNRMVPNCVPKTKTESFSAWRQDLSEIMTDDIDSKPIKEKKVVNKIKINPKLGEAVEEMGGTLIEQIEINEMDYVIESVYGELLEEGYSEDDVEFGIETALNSLDEDYYAAAAKASRERAKTIAKSSGAKSGKSMKDRLKSAAKSAIMGAGRAVGKAAKTARAVQATPGKAKAKVRSISDRVKSAAKAGYASGRGPVEKKPTTYRGAGVGRKEKVSEAVYGGEPAAPKDNRMTVTAADKKANTPAYQKYKAGDKRYKAADHMGEEVVDEALTGQRQMRARDMKGTPYQKGGGKRTARDSTTLHNLATRNEGPGTPGYEKKSTGGKGGRKFAGYGDQGAGNKARRRAGEQPMRGNRDPRNEEFASEEASMTTQELQLQKKKARIDRMIAQKRQQDLSKKTGGDAQPTKAMGEGMECVHNPKGKNCPVHGKEECPALTKEEASDAMKDRRMERGGVAGNVDYRRPPKNTNTNFGKKKPSGMSALDVVKAQIRAKHGKGAIIDTKKK